MKEDLLDAIGEIGGMAGSDEEDARLEGRHEVRDYRRIEVITGRRTRRSWTAKEKAEIVTATAEPAANISEIARRFGVSRGLLTVWRRQAGLTSWEAETTGFVPITVTAAERNDTPPARTEETPIADRGRIELDVEGARLVMTGGVDPGLAGAVVAALSRRR